MADLSQLSDQDLKKLYQIQKQESNNAPDSSTVTSSAGASGNMQVMPATGAQPGFGIKPSNGSPEDTARMGRDYYLALQDHYKDPTTAAIAYNWGPGNTDTWLKNGGNLKDVPDETLKYAYNFNKQLPAQQAPTQQQAPTPVDYSKMSDTELKAEYAKQNPPSAAKQRGMAAIQSMRPDVGAMGEALTGLGETGAQMATGMFGQAAGALHGAYELAKGGTYEQAKQALEQEREPVTYQPRTPAGQAISQNFGSMMEQYMTQPLEKGGQAVGEAFGFTPEESKQMAEVGTSLFENIGLPGLLHGNVPKGKIPEVGAPGISVDKLVPPDEAAAPSAEFVGSQRPPITEDQRLAEKRNAYASFKANGDPDDVIASRMINYQNLANERGEPMVLWRAESGALGLVPESLGNPYKVGEKVATFHPDETPPIDTTMGPNAGPQRGPFIATALGEVDTGLPLTPEQYFGTQAAERTAALQNPEAAARAAEDLFPETQMNVTGQASPWGQIEQAMAQAERGEGRPLTPEELERGGFTVPESPQGELNFERRGPYEMSTRPIEQLDPTSGVSHPDEATPAPRALAPDEFTQAVKTLVDRSPDKFSMPADMADAFDRYQRIVSGDMEPGRMAARFADAIQSQMREDRINNHPTIRANQSRVDTAQARLQDAINKQGPTAALRKQLDAATTTLEKAKDNIGKALGDDPRLPYAKDGAVNMYTFGYLPEIMKSIGAILKGIHGVVFKTLDRVLPSFKNLDSFGKIAGQGIKNFVNKEATRDWSQTVNAKPIEQASKIPGLREAVTELNPHAQDELSPEQLKQQFNSVPDLSSGKVGNALRNNLLQGGLMLSDFSQHPLVKYVTDSVAKAFRSSDSWVRTNLLDPKNGLGPMMKRMPKNEFTEIRTLMEAHEGVKEFTPNELKGRGYSDKQIEYYQRSLELQKDAFQKFNAGRVVAGLPPIEPRLAHIASYFTGDFKQVIKDSAGRVIAVLGHNNRAALGVIAKRFQEMHPDGDTLDMGKPELNKHTASDNTFQGYMNILDQLGKNNADIQRLVDVYRDTQMANTNKLSQMANRGKFKSNPENTVGGAEGAKLWQSMEKNAQDGGKQQLKYLESVNRWSEFQKAIQKSQDFIKDPEITGTNAKTVSQKYLDNQMHRNLGELNKFTNSFVNGAADIFGVGPSQMRQMANLTKTGLLNMFVGMGKFSHSLVTLMQPFLGIPEVNSIIKARGGDLGISQVTSALRAMASVKDIIQAHATKGDVGNPFVRAASEYARANDTFNTSQFNMGSINHQPTKLGNLLHINVTVPESGTRAFTYMYYAHMLKDIAGDSMTDKEIFGTAHNAVQKVMADYNKEAQAPVFNKMGFLGDLTRMLTTFKMNQISQAATAGKMALTQGKVMPLVTMMATSIAAAGLRGFIGYNIANGLLGQITTWATKQGMMNQPTNLDQMILHMLHGMNPHLRDALNFGATSALGIDMTGSLSHADDIPDDPLGTLIPEGGQIGKMLGSAMQFAEHPNVQRGKAALYDALPNSLKGVMENLSYTDAQGRYYDPHTGNLVTTRSPADQMKRNFSFRPLEESKERLAAEVSRGHEQQLSAVKSELSKRLLSDADSKSLTPEKWQQYSQQYINAGGDPRELVSQLVTHMGINKNLNIEQREAGIPGAGFTSAERYQRAQGFKQ